MATFETRISSKNETSYRVKIRILGYPPVNKTFSTMTLAKKWAKKTETEIEEGKYFPATKHKSKTLNDLINAYVAHVGLDNPRRLNELRPIMDWWKQELGYRLLSELTGEHFIAARQNLAKKATSKKDADGNTLRISVSTVNRYMVALNTAFNFSFSVLKWLQSNPMQGLKKLKEPEGRTRFLSPDEIARLMTACLEDTSPHIFAAVLLGISTGRRKGAITNLKWQDVDLETGRVQFWEQKTKTFAVSTISGCTLELLQRKFTEKGELESLIFPSPIKDGAAIDIRTAWERVKKRAQLEDFRFHDLKHTCASYMAMEGSSLLDLAKVLGHKTLNMVIRYAHLTEDHTAALQKKMNDKVLGNVKI